ncbi:MAG: TIGR02221 family CRISPR-associated protein [Wenzhouxiangellaceae bacterium]|nr:TIGR02221 family CRISPR-associated protein [Wenzhouxiangellaceae bacterium]
MNVLVSLLGKINRSSGYPTKTYRFDDGYSARAAFLGWVLQQRLQPDHLIIIGSSTSMWDHLFEGDLDFADRSEDLRMELMNLCENGSPVPARLLERLAPILGARLGCAVSLIIAPRGLDSASQMTLFQHLAQAVNQGDRLTIDCTHGFRHMPMLLMAGAQYLQGLGKVSVQSIYYGLMDAGADEARVCRLDSLLEIERGVRALDGFDAGGDYEPLIRLLGHLLPPSLSAARLREAAFHERTLRIPQARKTLQEFYRFLENVDLPFPHELLKPALLERLSWANEPTHHRRQLAASRIALSRRDYPRTAALLFEAWINQVVHSEKLGDPEKTDVREKARGLLDERLKTGSAPKAIDLLRRLRNATAHGARPVGADAQRLLASEEKLNRFLVEMISALDR